jgi:ribonuclease P protein subunit POP4
LIGLNVVVIESRDRGILGVHGVVIDETKNTLVIRRDSKTIIVPKNVARFRFYLPRGGFVDLEGRCFVGRPEDRIKTVVKK